MGTAAENRANVTLQNVVFSDCDVNQDSSVPGSGQAGAIMSDLGALTMQNSMVLSSDAAIAGGGLMLINQSSANITGSTIARNSAASFGAGIYVQGSNIVFDNGRIINNEISPGVSEAAGASLGAGIFATPDAGVNAPVTGSISNSVISNNIGLPIYDDDRTNGPINDLRYNNNQIFSTTFGTSVYNNPLSGLKTVAQLNSLVVSRSNGTSTAKSQTANSAPASAPVVGAILAVPPAILPVNAAGDSAPPTISYLGYAWSGASATLDSGSVSGNAGLSPTVATGTHVLAVGSTQFPVTVGLAATPSAALSANPNPIPSGATSTLSWSTPGGTFLDDAIDQGVAIAATASGSVGVSPSVSTTYRFFDVVEEGGDTAAVTVDIGTVPGVPTITDPSAGQVIGVEGVTFTWTSPSGATSYDLRIVNGAGATVFTGTLSGGSSTLIGLPSNGTYTFRVRACMGTISDSTCSAFASRTFTVSLVAPSAAPTITFPTANAAFSTSQQTLQWTTVAGNPSLPDLFYEVVLTNRTTGQTELNLRTRHPTAQAAAILRSVPYRMQVRACQAACGPFSAPVNFSVALGAVPSTAPSITSAVVNGGNSLTASWTAVTGAEWYQIQVIQPRPAGPGGSALTVAARQVSATSVTLPVPAGQASVIVAACNGDGCGPYSPAMGINPTGPNPSAAQMGSPLDGSVVNGPSVLFTWTRVPGDSGNTVYRLYVQDVSRSRAALDVYTTQNFYGALLKAEGSKYAVQAIANPGTANQVNGPPVTFTVRGSSGVAPTLMAPTNASVLNAGNILVGWTPVPGATLYEYLLSVQGASVASGRGVTPGIFVQVPLAAVNGQPTVYNGIVRACPAGQTCAPGSDAGWGPWSSAAGSGGISFTIVP
jgi:hypothetical protein